jgi:hypothetical protein
VVEPNPKIMAIVPEGALLPGVLGRFSGDRESGRHPALGARWGTRTAIERPDCRNCVTLDVLVEGRGRFRVGYGAQRSYPVRESR